MKKAADLGNEPVLKLIMKLTVPAMLAQLVNVLYGIVDRIFIGNIPVIGDLALAGVGVCTPIVTLISSFGTLVGIGGSVIMGMTMGMGDNKKAKKILANSFLLLLVFSFVLTVIFLIAKENMIFWFGGSDATFKYADTYLTIYTLGTFFALLALGLSYFINCQGFSVNGMTAVFIGAIGNIILDALFVPILKLGVAGAAWATVISQLLSCLYAILFLFGKKVKIKISFGNYDFKMMKNIIKMGISPFIIIATDSIIMIAMNTALQLYGGAQADSLIFAVTVMQSCFLLITGPLAGISGGVQPIVSFNFGARSEKRVKQTVLYALIEGLILTTSMFFVFRAFAADFVRIFSKTAEITKIAVWGINVFIMMIIPLSFQYVLVDALTAMGCVKISLYLSAFRKISYTVFIFLFASQTTAKNAFYAQPAADMISSIQSTVVFLLVFKRYMRKHTKTNPTSISTGQPLDGALQNNRI